MKVLVACEESQAVCKAFKNKENRITIACGCYCGSLEEFEKRVLETHGENKYGKEYKTFIDLVKLHFEVEE